jgi:hypothetical protein
MKMPVEVTQVSFSLHNHFSAMTDHGCVSIEQCAKTVIFLLKQKVLPQLKENFELYFRLSGPQQGTPSFVCPVSLRKKAV